METALATGTLLAVAALDLCFGAVILLRNPAKPVNRAFALLALAVVLWCVVILLSLRSDTDAEARFWLLARGAAGVLIVPALLVFVTLFPQHPFRCNRVLFGLIAASVPVMALSGLTRLFVREVHLEPNGRLEIAHGPLVYGILAWLLLVIAYIAVNLAIKHRHAAGSERRQIEHVFIGTLMTTILVVLTNVVAPLLGEKQLYVYGPIWTLILVAWVAYSMARYQLLGVPELLSRTVLYTVLTVFVAATFLGTVFLVDVLFQTWWLGRRLVPTILGALVIVMLLQPLKERLQRLLERRLLKRRYDISRLLGRISSYVAELADLDEMIGAVARDIQDAVGARTIRVLLVSERAPGAVTIQYSSDGAEAGREVMQYADLVRYAANQAEAVRLDQLVQEPPSDQRVHMAALLAEAEIYVCVPLRQTRRLVGFLAFGPKTSQDIYSADDMAVFAAVAGPWATAIENARLYRQLEEAHVHLTRLLESMRGAVVAVDERGTVTTFNRSAVRLLGPLMVGQPVDSLPEEIREVIEHAIETGRETPEFETATRGSDGTAIPVAIASTCLATPEGERSGAMVMIYDLSRLRRLEQHVQRAERLSSVGLLAAGMAHEIKNPLVSIQTFAQLLPTHFDDADFRQTFAEVVPDEVARINELVGQMLDLGQPRPVVLEPVALEPVLEGVLKLLGSQVKKANAVIQRVFDGTGTPVIGDSRQLHQIFFNLLLNALDALKGTGGELCVAVENTRKHLKRDVLVPTRETLCRQVTIRDSGCGIAPEHLDQLFTPFFTTKVEGRGLGLAVVYGMITEMGGEIDVSSAIGVGTTVTVSIPVANVTEPTEPREEAADASHA